MLSIKMKDLFCLVNSFINRSKTDCSNNDKNNLLSVPFEASKDVRVLPGASRKNNFILSSLEPFIQLLPDLSAADLETQKRLHALLYSAGVSAALLLHQFLYDPQKSVYLNNSILSNVNRNNSEWKEILNQLGKHIDYEEHAAAFRKLSQKLSTSDLDQILRNENGQSLIKMISNKVAAAALAAFASATYRRPPTKHVDRIMAPAQDTGTTSGDDDGYNRTIRELAFANNSKCVNDIFTENSKSKQNVHANQLSTTNDGNKEESEENECNCENGDCEYIEDEDCLFRYVCAAGYQNLVEILLKLRKSSEFVQMNESTPLMEACCGGHADVVRTLIKAGADVNALSSTQNTALNYACGANHIECVRELLKSGKCDLSLRNEYGHCALMEAANIGNVEMMKLLVEHGAVPIPVFDNTDFKESALTLASYKGHVEAVRFLISIIPDSSDREEEYHTALMEASMDGHLEVTRLLLNAGALVNLPSDSFESPLTLAACGGHTELVALLVDFGADLEESNDEGYTPLMEASREGHRDVVELLLDCGANVNAKIDEGMETSLTLAASGGFLNVVELLVARGGDLTIGSPLYEATQEGHVDVAYFIVHQLRKTATPSEVLKDLNSSLLCAAEINNVTICNMLIENSAQIECFSQEGRNVLMEACRQGNLLVVELLIHKGANVNAISPNEEWTPLSLAASHGHADIVRYLLEHGADSHQSLKDSSTALLEATKNGHTDCVEVLLDYSVSMCPSQCGRGILNNLPAGKLNNCLHNQKSCNHAKLNENTIKQTDLHNISKITGKSSQSIGSQTSSTLVGSNSDIASSNASQLFRALAAAAATSSYNGPDDWLFAHFIQKSLFTSRKRETISEEELRSFTEMIQHQFRTIFPSSQVDAAALISANQEKVHVLTELAERINENFECGSNNNRKILTNQQSKRKNDYVIENESNKIAHYCHHSPCQLSDIDNSNFKTKFNNESKLNKTLKNADINFLGLDQKMTECRDMLMSKLADFSLEEISDNVECSISSNAEILNNQFNSHSSLCNIQKQRCQHSLYHSHNIGCHRSTCCNTTNCLSSCDTQLSLPNQIVLNQKNLVRSSPAPSSVTSTSTSTSVTQTNQNLIQDSTFGDLQLDGSHDTALTLACVGGHTTLANLLIQRGADIEHRDKKGFTPLILASTGGHLEICKMLVDAGCQVDAQADRTKDTALSLACSGGRKEIVDFLLKNNANKEHRNISDYTPLSLAASGGYVDIIQLLLNNGAEINSRTGSKLGISPLMLSAMNGHEAATMLLLDSGSDINAQIETNRNTALTLACFQGRTEVVRILVQYGANVEHRAKTGLTPLMEAANGGYVDVGTILLEAGADPNSPPVMTSRDTALTIASDKGHAAFVEILIHAGAQINVRNKKGCSALWLACSGGYLETTKTLVKHNADTNALDNRKVSPLMIAFRKGHVSIVEYLVLHVSQFPNDQECSRYISTLSDTEMITKCNTCLDYISLAKAKQAEEANKAAESLLEMLAQEEALAESKKRSKQRQKEKKKAKKIAKKQIFKEEIESKISVVVEKEEESKIVIDKTLLDQRKTLSSSKEVVNDTKSSSITLVESRVPSLALIESSSVFNKKKTVEENKLHNSYNNVSIKNLPNSMTPVSIQKNIRRHGRRGGRGCSNTVLSNNSVLNDSKLNRVDTLNKFHNGDEAEWLRASKRRNFTIKRGKTQNYALVNHTPSNSLKSISYNINYVKNQSSDATTVGPQIDEWVNDPNYTSSISTSKRKSHVLSVSSNVIARVIGRAGSNINAIREATNAHIEVEKMTTKREQATRLITIKGTSEAIKNSVNMIEMLIKNQDTHITDILKAVLNNNVHVTEDYCVHQKATPNFSSSEFNILSEPYYTTPAYVGDNKKFDNSIGSKQFKTNVWQERAAIRELKKNNCENLNLSSIFFLQKHENNVKKNSAQTLQNNSFFPQERRAPGYERPNSSSSNSNVAPSLRLSPNVIIANNGSQIPLNLSQVANEKVTVMNSLNEINIFKESASQTNQFQKSNALSNIWENSSTTHPFSSSSLVNLNGFFDNDPNTSDLTNAFWLPQLDNNSNKNFKKKSFECKNEFNDKNEINEGTADWLGKIFLNTPKTELMVTPNKNTFVDSNIVSENLIKDNKDLTTMPWDFLNDWNTTLNTSNSDFKWNFIGFDSDVNGFVTPEKTDILENVNILKNTDSNFKKEKLKVFNERQLEVVNEMPFNVEDFIQVNNTSPTVNQHTPLMQNFQQQNLLFEFQQQHNDYEKQQTNAPYYNNTRTLNNNSNLNSNFSISNLQSQAQEVLFHSFFVNPQQHLLNPAISNGTNVSTGTDLKNTVPFCQNAQHQNYHSSFPITNNFEVNQQQLAGNLNFNNTNTMTSSRFIHPPPGFACASNSSTQNLYDISVSQIHTTTGLKLSTMTGSCGNISNNSVGQFLPNVCVNSQNFVSSSITRSSAHQQQQKIYKNSIANELNASFLNLQNNQQAYSVNDETNKFWTPISNSTISIFSQHCPTHSQIVGESVATLGHQNQTPIKNWKDFC